MRFMNKRIKNFALGAFVPWTPESVKVSKLYEKIISREQKTASLCEVFANRANITQTLLLAMVDVQDAVIEKRITMSAFQFQQKWATNPENFVTLVDELFDNNKDYFAIDLKLTIGQYSIPKGARGLLETYCQKVAYWVATGLYESVLIDDYIQSNNKFITVYNENTKSSENVLFSDIMAYLKNIVVTATTYYLLMDNYGSEPYMAIERITSEIKDRFSITENIVSESIEFISNNVHQLYSLPDLKTLVQTLCDSTIDTLSDKGINNPTDILGEEPKELLNLSDIHFNYFTGNSIYAIVCTGLGLVPSFLSSTADAITSAVFGLFVILANVGNTLTDFLTSMAESLFHARDPIDCSIINPNCNNLTFDNASMGPPIIIDPNNSEYLKPTFCRSFIESFNNMGISKFLSTSEGYELAREEFVQRLNENFVRQYHSDEFFKTVTINVKGFEISGGSLYMTYYVQYRYKPIRGGLNALIEKNVLIRNDEDSTNDYISYKFADAESAPEQIINIVTELISSNFLYNNDSAWNNKSMDNSDTAFFTGITMSIIFDYILQHSLAYYNHPMTTVIYGNPNVESSSSYHFYNDATINRLNDYEANLFTNKEFYQLLSFDYNDDTVEAYPNTAINKYLAKEWLPYYETDLCGIKTYLLHNAFCRCISIPLYNISNSEGSLMLLPSEPFLDDLHKFHINTDSENTTRSALALAQTWGLVAITACSVLGAKLILSANRRIFEKNLKAYQQLQIAAITGDTNLTPFTISRINNTVFSKGSMPAAIFNTNGAGNSEIVSNITETILSVLK